jgi:hypothetical protein
MLLFGYAPRHLDDRRDLLFEPTITAVYSISRGLLVPREGVKRG